MSEVEATVMGMVLELPGLRGAGHRGVRTRALRVAHEGPGEAGAEDAEGDRYPGQAAHVGPKGAAATLQGVEHGTGCGEGDRAGHPPVHRQHAVADASLPRPFPR